MTRELVRTLRLVGERTVPLGAAGRLALEAPTEAATVAALLAEGLLRRVPEGVVRTAEGRAFLRRALAEGPDAFAAQHRDVGTATVAGLAVAVNAAESPLGWLATRRDKDGRPLIAAEEFAAGRRLAADFARGVQRQRVTQSWDASGVRGGGGARGLSPTEAAAEARRRTEAALAAVGPGLAEVLVAVCCEEVGLEAVEKRQRWPQRSGKVVLRLALQRLAAHYGLAAVAVGAGARGLVHWGSADYRPAA